MNLKHFFIFSFTCVLALVYSSCNDDTVTTTYGDISNDGQIYSFTLKGPSSSKIDTIISATHFSIDEQRRLIYNADSLPYQTKLIKFATTMIFSNAGYPAELKIRFVNDSTPSWNGTDSVDYTLAKGFMVTAPSGEMREYTLDLRVHQVDPDSISWTKLTTLNQSQIVENQKTVLKNSIFYTYYKYASTLRVASFNKDSETWEEEDLKGLPNDVVLESMSLYNNYLFCAIDVAGYAYTSVDGITWTDLGFYNVHSILGELPSEGTDDSHLLTVKSEPDISGNEIYRFARTKDMKTYELLNIRGSAESNKVPSNFLSDGFTSTKDDTTKKLLVTGGHDFHGTLKNKTWSLAYTNDMLEILETSKNVVDTIIEPNKGIPTFMYDDKLYAINSTKFASSANWGYGWINQPKSQKLPLGIGNALGYTVIVDKENYIWIFSGVSKPIEVWKGRLNKLNPIKPNTKLK